MAADAAELKRLTSELRSSPGFKVHSEINNNRRSLRILSRNMDELIQSVVVLKKQAVVGSPAGANESPSLALALEETARRLESFLSSAYDLIDYTRRYCRKLYEKTDYSREIQSEIDRRFIFEADYKLSQGLRSVSAHVDSLQSSLNPIQSNEERDLPYKIQVKQLLTWDEWNDNQRRMLEAMQDDIDVKEFAQRYFRKIEEFYSWLWKRQSEIHARELAEAEEMRVRAKEAYDRLFPPGA
jgi:hypothetical protein